MSSSSIDFAAAPPRKQLVTFGVTMACALAAVMLLRVWRRGMDEVAIAAAIVAALFAVSALVAPAALSSVYLVWMRFAEALGWLNTRILLIVIFYVVVTPIGLVMRLFRRSPLPGGYWTEPPRNSYGDRHYEKQF
ncbi:MAG TPA: SxtJ family membrane protein [Thermoanaerobaculia bacterium]|nr:SxtJ family membrane protein [Thermoanaerobaculia bacterium]